MDKETIKRNIQKVLSPSRYRHSEATSEVAKDLAVIYGVDQEKAEMAGILHDCARFLYCEELVEECRKNNIPISDTELKDPLLLHGKVSSLYANKLYGIEDEDILNAITYHTTGRPGMSLLEKIIFTADYIEPYRMIPGVNEIRVAAYNELDSAIIMILKSNLEYLKNKNVVIDKLTEETYKYMINQKEK